VGNNMGVDVAAIASLVSAVSQTASSFSGINNAKREASAKVAEGNIAAENKAREVLLKAAQARSSFLTSGLTLEGTPLAAIDDIFTVGLADINQIRSNTNVAASGIVSNARTKALKSAESSLSGVDWMGKDSVINTMTGGWSSRQGYTGGLDPKSGITWNSGRKL
jgi:acyl CoA:acetate/3-ketoacid CoA transferase alpha subunit